MSETEHPERRQHKRIPFIKEVEAVGLGMLQCSDLSMGGMSLEAVKPFPVGTVFDLRFKLRETDDYPITVQARVAYTHGDKGFSLNFFSLRLEDRQNIEKFIEEA